MKYLLFLIIFIGAPSFGASINPISYYFNSSFDVIQNPYDFSQEHYFKNHEILFKRITSPVHSIEKDGGWDKFFKDEFLGSRAVPNVGLHTIGAGHDSKLLENYYNDRGYPYPLFFAIVTAYLGHFGNESIELSSDLVTSHDNIADLFFYDVAGIILFQNDKIFNYFVDDLKLETWGYQPFIDVENGRVNNAGLNYIFRPDLFKNKIKPFFFMGMQLLGGISYELNSKEFISISSGIAITDPLESKGKLAGALFYDSEGEQKCSLIINGSEEYRARLNVYPDFLIKSNYKLGGIIGYKRDDSLALGVNFVLPIGIGTITSL